jgi:aromatic ring-opening dioxygenase LigB subunit
VLALTTSMPAEVAAQTGRDLVAGDERVALLVMGDGTARRSVSAPGYVDERAEGFDAAVAAALKTADADALLALDPHLGDELLVAGRVAWQVLAGAAGNGCTGELLYDEAPYGVGYFVATWTP